MPQTKMLKRKTKTGPNKADVAGKKKAKLKKSFNQRQTKKIWKSY
jgi:hypothetical protein